MDQKLLDLIEKARTHVMTPEEQEEQRVSFAYGNAPADDRNTKEAIRGIATAMRETQAAK